MPSTSGTSCSESSCKGICKGHEAIAQYNLRVKEALSSMSATKERIFLKLKGRSQNEEAFVFIENGVYRGYGFVDAQQAINSEEDLKAFLVPQKSTLETQQIVDNALSKLESQFSIP